MAALTTIATVATAVAGVSSAVSSSQQATAANEAAHDQRMADKKQNYKDEQALNRLKEEELAKRKEKIDLQRKQVLGGTDPNAYSLSSSGSSGTVQIPSLTGSVLG